MNQPKIQTCTRCGWEFIPTRVKRNEVGKIIEILLPKTCPNPACNSPYWNKPRTKGSTSIEQQSNDTRINLSGEHD